MPDIRLSPRRLGLINLWVSDPEQAVGFYEVAREKLLELLS